MGIPDHLTCLLRNLYAGQEGTVRTRHGTKRWFKIGKGVHQGCILSPCLFNFYAEYIVWNTKLHESQAGIKIARRNINNFRYADDTSQMAESEEELKSLLMRVKEESEKTDLKLDIKKKLRSWHLVPSLHGKYMGKKWKQWQILFSWTQKPLQKVTAAMKLKDACSRKKSYDKLYVLKSRDIILPLVAQLVKNPPTMWETWVWSLGWEDPLEMGKATHSCILAWRIPWTL